MSTLLWLLLQTTLIDCMLLIVQQQISMLTQDESILINESCFVLDQHLEPDFQRASSLKQQSEGRHAFLPWHIFLTLGWPVFALSSKCWVLGEEVANTNFNVFGLKDFFLFAFFHFQNKTELKHNMFTINNPYWYNINANDIAWHKHSIENLLTK